MTDRSTPAVFEIGGRTFYVLRMPPFEALKVFGDLQRDLLPALGALGPAVLGDKGTEKIDADAFAAAVRQASMALDGASLDRWAKRLLVPERVSFEADDTEPQKLAPARFDAAFGEFTDIIELLYRVIVLEFAGPFGQWLSRTGLAGRLADLTSSASTPNGSPPNS